MRTSAARDSRAAACRHSAARRWLALDHVQARHAEELDGEQADVRLARGSVDEQAIGPHDARELPQQRRRLARLLQILAPQRRASGGDEQPMQRGFDGGELHAAMLPRNRSVGMRHRHPHVAGRRW